MSQHVIAAIRSPRIGGPLLVLNERTHPNEYETDQWISKSTAEWRECAARFASHFMIIILNGRMVPRCLYEQPVDPLLPREKFTGTHLAEALKAFSLDDRAPAEVSGEPLVCTTQDMTDRDEVEGRAA